MDAKDVLVVAFNRVIARQLREDIGARLKTFEHTHDPIIRTIHALCVEVIGDSNAASGFRAPLLDHGISGNDTNRSWASNRPYSDARR